jgi:hypothetical protein
VIGIALYNSKRINFTVFYHNSFTHCICISCNMEWLSMESDVRSVSCINIFSLLLSSISRFLADKCRYY